MIDKTGVVSRGVRLFCVFFSMLISSHVYAQYKECIGKVDSVQADRAGIFFMLKDQNWHYLGDYSDSTKAMYSALLSAQAAGRTVVVRFPLGFDCNQYEIQTAPLMVRINSD